MILSPDDRDGRFRPFRSSEKSHHAREKTGKTQEKSKSKTQRDRSFRLVEWPTNSFSKTEEIVVSGFSETDAPSTIVQRL